MQLVTKIFRFWHLIAFQCLILAVMFLKAFYPLWTGEEVVFRVMPRDPRDMFRGNYVSLNYAFSVIATDSLPNDLKQGKTYRFGDVLYLELKKTGEVHVPNGLYEQCPEGKLCLRVMPAYAYTHEKGGYIYLQGGIESYFTDRKQAERLERLASSTGSDSVRLLVSVKVAPDGAARITKVALR